jgi:hypothetical protein
MLRPLYDKVIALSASRHALPALATISFAESSFFPVPPDVLEISKLGRIFFVGYRTFTAQPQALPYTNLNEKKAADRRQGASAEANVNPEPARRRTAAQSTVTKRKTGTVTKSQSGSKRSAKAKRKAGSVRRSKG